ncbi:MAG: branched-chain amino acid ABC transporter permease [Aigarchaeota archaeon]|nr:branched-chain amino acid ABC transporter permease [Candidatus Pelearchaeum maunauluense]
MKKGFIAGIILLATASAVPMITQEPYILQTLSIAYVFAIYSIGWNILALSGQVSLGHAAFFGIGAYSSVILARAYGLPPAITVVVGPLFTALVGLGIGLLCVRLKEWFLAMVTFGFAVIMQAIVVDDQLRWLTNGWDGLLAPHLIPPEFEPRRVWNYYALLAATVITYIASYLIFNSRLGLAFKTIRDNELVARVCGVKTMRYKLLSFVISTYIAGVAGALQYHVLFRFLSPEVFHLQTSFWPLIFTVGGGLGTLEGPLIGSIILWLAWEAFRAIAGFYGLIGLGIFLALVIILMPGGIRSLIAKAPSLIYGFGERRKVISQGM